jgi:hypothetical protein
MLRFPQLNLFTYLQPQEPIMKNFKKSIRLSLSFLVMLVLVTTQYLGSPQSSDAAPGVGCVKKGTQSCSQFANLQTCAGTPCVSGNFGSTCPITEQSQLIAPGSASVNTCSTPATNGGFLCSTFGGATTWCTGKFPCDRGTLSSCSSVLNPDGTVSTFCNPPVAGQASTGNLFGIVNATYGAACP